MIDIGKQSLGIRTKYGYRIFAIAHCRGKPVGENNRYRYFKSA